MSRSTVDASEQQTAKHSPDKHVSHVRAELESLMDAIASLPDTDDRNGYKLIMAGRDKVRAQITVDATNIPTGRYTLEETPVFEDDLDWFILREVK